MVKLQFPDGSFREYEDGIEVIKVAEMISVSLKKKCVAAKLNDVLVDLDTKINSDSSIVFVTTDSPEAFEILNHSTAHLLAHAVSILYPNAKMGVGPAIEEGFYYDFDFGDTKLEPADLVKIEKKMVELSNKEIAISHYDLSKEEAKKLMANDPYKVELIEAARVVINAIGTLVETDECKARYEAAKEAVAKVLEENQVAITNIKKYEAAQNKFDKAE